jgi:hypothetical protein
MLRRAMALAELIGLPRAAQRASATLGSPAPLQDANGNASKLASGAILWKSICSIDRLVGMCIVASSLARHIEEQATDN